MKLIVITAAKSSEPLLCKCYHAVNDLYIGREFLHICIIFVVHQREGREGRGGQSEARPVCSSAVVRETSSRIIISM